MHLHDIETFDELLREHSLQDVLIALARACGQRAMEVAPHYATTAKAWDAAAHHLTIVAYLPDVKAVSR